MVTAPELSFYYDYVDPASFLLEGALEAVESASGVQRRPYEIQPPPRPMVDPRDRGWRTYWDAMIEAGREMGVELVRPEMTPWSRKAHELALHAREVGAFPEVHRAVFRAHMLEGRDIGRVDVLVEIGTAAGLDLTRTKAVLDVDRHTAEIVRLREEAERRGVRGVPTLLVEGRRLEGFHAPDRLRSFLAGP